MERTLSLRLDQPFSSQSRPRVCGCRCGVGGDNKKSYLVITWPTKNFGPKSPCTSCLCIILIRTRSCVMPRSEFRNAVAVTSRFVVSRVRRQRSPSCSCQTYILHVLCFSILTSHYGACPGRVCCMILIGRNLY
jgi:hypothetical protein